MLATHPVPGWAVRFEPAAYIDVNQVACERLARAAALFFSRMLPVNSTNENPTFTTVPKQSTHPTIWEFCAAFVRLRLASNTAGEVLASAEIGNESRTLGLTDASECKLIIASPTQSWITSSHRLSLKTFEQ